MAMNSRRQFCKATAAGALSAGLPGSSMAWTDPSPFRATPNPHNDHFTTEDAKRCVGAWSADDPLLTQCLELVRYRTASIDALTLLAQRKWMVADFGLAVLTEDVAHAIGQLSIHCMEFHHVEHASAKAIAHLASVSEELAFSEVESLSARGIVNLRESVNPLTPSQGISIGGEYLLDRTTARALASLPMNIDLYPARKELALTTGAWSELSDAPEKHLQIHLWPPDSPLSCQIAMQHGTRKDAVIRTWDAEAQMTIERRLLDHVGQTGWVRA